MSLLNISLRVEIQVDFSQVEALPRWRKKALWQETKLLGSSDSLSAILHP